MVRPLPPDQQTPDVRELARRLSIQAGSEYAGGSTLPGEQRTSWRWRLARLLRYRPGFLTSLRRSTGAERYIDISMLGAYFLAGACLMFLPFVVTSTFPISVKWLLVCVEVAGIGFVLLVLAAWIRGRQG